MGFWDVFKSEPKKIKKIAFYKPKFGEEEIKQILHDFGVLYNAVGTNIKAKINDVLDKLYNKELLSRKDVDIIVHYTKFKWDKFEKIIKEVEI